MIQTLDPNLVLIGYMGTGKSAVGRRCARALRYRFVDTDVIVERRAGCSISDLFASRGEQAFRAMEADAVSEAAERVHVVIATGGGAVLNPRNVDALRRTGVLVWLRATPEEIVERCKGAATRPLLAGASDPLARVRAMLAERAPAYEAAADAVVEGTGLPLTETARRVLQAYRELAARWPGSRNGPKP